MAEPTAPAAQPPANANANANAPAPPAQQGAAAQQPAAQVPPALAAMLPAQPPAQPAAAQPAQGQQPAAAPAGAQPAVPAALAAILQQGAAAQGQQPAAPAQQPAAPAAAPPKRTPEEEVASLRAELRARDVRSLVVATATEAGAVNAEQVHALVAGDLDVADDGRVIVRNDPRADARQHVARFLAANLHLLRPVVPGGGAGSPAVVQAPGAAQALNPHTREGGTQVVHGLLGRLFPTPTAPATGGAAATR